MVTGSDDALIKVWSTHHVTDRGVPSAVHTLRGHTGAVVALEVGVSSGSPVAVSGSHDGSARMWELDTGTLLHTFVGHAGAVLCLALSAGDDGQLGIDQRGRRAPNHVRMVQEERSIVPQYGHMAGVELTVAHMSSAGSAACPQPRAFSCG